MRSRCSAASIRDHAWTQRNNPPGPTSSTPSAPAASTRCGASCWSIRSGTTGIVSVLMISPELRSACRTSYTASRTVPSGGAGARSAAGGRRSDRPLRVRGPGPASAMLMIRRERPPLPSRREPVMNFWDIILSIFWFMLLFAWIWLLISIFADIFRDHELSGWGKALWALFIIVIPWLGALVYLIARGRSMNERTLAQAQRQDHAFRHYVQDAAGNQPSAADEIAKLATLRDQGAISEQEFAHAKAKLLGTPSNGAPVPPNQAASVH